LPPQSTFLFLIDIAKRVIPAIITTIAIIRSSANDDFVLVADGVGLVIDVGVVVGVGAGVSFGVGVGVGVAVGFAVAVRIVLMDIVCGAVTFVNV